MFKILQVRLQQYMNCELPDVQAGFRKGKGTRDQIANFNNKNNTMSIECLLCDNPYMGYFTNIILVIPH